MEIIYTLTEFAGRRYITKDVNILNTEEKWKEKVYRSTKGKDYKSLQFVAFSTKDEQRRISFKEGTSLFERI